MSSADEEDMDVDTESNVGATGGQERNIVHRQPKWTEDENMALAHAAHEDSDPLRNRFQGGSGGKDRKKAAWARVASEFLKIVSMDIGMICGKILMLHLLIIECTRWRLV